LAPLVGADPASVPLDALHSAIVIMTACAGVVVVALLRLNNPWLIGAVVGAATLAIAGWIDGRLPAVLYNLGQILVGISIGAQFKRNIVMSMLRVCVTAIASIVMLSAVLVLLARLIAACTSIDYGTAILATSAGGMAEMSATAIALHLDVALVAAFHFVRVFIINGFALYFWRLSAWWLNDRSPKV
jgi:membrane AbrB-like protein